MDINKIMEIADGAYDADGVILCHWDKKLKCPRKRPLYGMGDTLARFIVNEIYETYQAGDSDGEQLETAAHCIWKASSQCIDVGSALLDAIPKGKAAKEAKEAKALEPDSYKFTMHDIEAQNAMRKPTTAEKVERIASILEKQLEEEG